MKLRVLTVTDLHQRAALYEQLSAAVERHKPDVLACVGDFLDAEFEADVIPSAEAAKILAGLPCEVVFARGNHEDWRWPEFEAAWHATGRSLLALHGTACSFGPLVAIGFPCWMGSDEHYGRDRHLDRYSPEDWLPKLIRTWGPAGRTLWLMHEPPTLDLADNFFVTTDWRDAIENYLPLVTVSGHDHTTPLKTGRWHAQVGSTLCINAGQRVYPKPGKLIHCVLDFEFGSERPSLTTSFAYRKFG